MKITAISGWAIPSDWFSEQIGKYFKNSEINVIYPNNPFDSEEARIKINTEQDLLILKFSLWCQKLLVRVKYPAKLTDQMI